MLRVSFVNGTKPSRAVPKSLLYSDFVTVARRVSACVALCGSLELCTLALVCVVCFKTNQHFLDVHKCRCVVSGVSLCDTYTTHILTCLSVFLLCACVVVRPNTETRQMFFSHNVVFNLTGHLPPPPPAHAGVHL